MIGAGRAWCVLAALLLHAAAADAAGVFQAIEREGLKVTIDAEWSNQAAPGYLPVRLDFTNLTDARDIDISIRSIRMFAPWSRPGGAPQAASTNVRQRIRLARGARVRFTLPVPVLADSESLVFEIFENGRRLESLGGMSLRGTPTPDDAAVLIVASSSTPFGEMTAGWPRVVGSPPPAGAVTVRPPGPPVTSFGKLPPLDFVLDPSRLPTNWLGYTSLRAVVIGPSEWQQLTDEQRAALRTWIAAGGDLLLVDGSLDTVFPGNAQEVSVDSGSVVPYLFGNVHMVASKTVIADGLSHVIATMPAAGDPNWTLPVTRAADWTDLPTRGFRLPIRGVGGVPARAYLVILTLFSLIIGPANYLFLRRRRRQALLVLTVPLISCAFILLLATYVVAGEGFGVHGRSASLTMLDQRRQQAATRGSVSLYAAGWTPGAGLRFPRDMAVLPRGRDNRANAEELGLDLAESQRFAGGLVRARVPSNFETIAVRPARERLTFVHEGGNLSVVNGLGGPIRTLVYRTADAAYALDAPLAAGQKTVLRPAARALEAELPASHPMFARFVTTTQKQPAGSYIALMDRSPFWQPGIEGIAERDNLHMVLGLVEGEP